MNIRKWHRWIGAGAAIFFLLVSVTGVLLQFQQFFGEEEAEKEKLRESVSAYSLSSSFDDIQQHLKRVQSVAQSQLGGDAKIDKMVWQLKGEHPTVTLYTSGKENDKFVFNAKTDTLEKRESAEEESFLLRLHTGEVFGDVGVVMGMLWGTALVFVTITGTAIYLKMRKAAFSRRAG